MLCSETLSGISTVWIYIFKVLRSPAKEGQALILLIQHFQILKIAPLLFFLAKLLAKEFLDQRIQSFKGLSFLLRMLFWELAKLETKLPSWLNQDVLLITIR